MTATEVLDTLPDDLRIEVNHIIGWKDHIVSQMGDENNGDIPPVLAVFRDDRLLCTIFCRNVDRDEGLQAAQMAVPGFSADALVIHLDAHYADQRWIDRTGRTPDPGELQHQCDAEGACELGLITDTIYTVRRWRDGRVQMVNLPYHVNKSAMQTHWQPEITYMDSDEEGVELSGRVPDALDAIFGIPPLGSMIDDFAREEGKSATELGAEYGVDTPEKMRFHMDMAVMTILSRAGFAVMWNPQSQEELDAVKASMRAAGLGGVAHAPGAEEELEAEPNPAGDIMALMLRERLQRARDESHAEDKAEAERRRAAREYEAVKERLGLPPSEAVRKTAYVNVLEPTGHTHNEGNRAQRRAAARKKR